MKFIKLIKNYKKKNKKYKSKLFKILNNNLRQKFNLKKTKFQLKIMII